MELKIKKWGNSQGIRITNRVLDMLNMDKNDTFEAVLDEKNEQIILKKIESKNSEFLALFENYKGEIDQEEFDWGEPVGDEIW